NKAVETISRVLSAPPKLLGFVLPRSFTDGQLYKDIRTKLVETYDAVSIIALPDNVFQYSNAETVLVLASGQSNNDAVELHRMFIAKGDYEQFWETGKPTWENKETFKRSTASSYPLWEHSLATNLKEYLKDLIKLEDVADIHRGIEYQDSVSNHVSNIQRTGFKKGLQKVEDGLNPYAVLNHRYIDLNPNSMLYKAYLRPWESPKVIASAIRISRGAWKIISATDRSGLYCYHAFHGIWPKGDFSLEIITAVLNGLVANALLSISPQTRNIPIKDLRPIPVPNLSENDIQWIEQLVAKYKESLTSKNYSRSLDIVTQINVLILSRYNLPSWLLSDLLEYIGYEEQPRINVSFVEQIRMRHRKLVDKKFLEGLTPKETQELEQINNMLDAVEEKYYTPIKNELAMLSESILTNKQ
ncbi:MAG: hypothetical protein GWP15_03485, partial [Nitrospirae bacterium]|nr:hypothetical protein [Nitrospirota bacterium]